MTLVGCDLHSRKQQVAVLDTTTGEVLEQELVHEGEAVERFYRALRPAVTLGIYPVVSRSDAPAWSYGPRRRGGEDQSDGRP